jgi:hypothetical protein
MSGPETVLFLLAIGVMGPALAWLIVDYREWSAWWDSRKAQAERDAYLEARRNHAEYRGIRVVGGSRYGR